MSYFLFGEYVESQHNKVMKKKYGIDNNIIYNFDEEINFYNDIFTMISENTIFCKKKIFCITSELQMKNSSDILSPWDKYTNEELFPINDDRTVFGNICKKNIELLFESLKIFVQEIQPINLRIYVVDGYDNNFILVKSDLRDTCDELVKQIINDDIESTIYEIRT